MNWSENTRPAIHPETEGTDYMLQIVKPAQSAPLSVYLAGKMDDRWRYNVLPPLDTYVDPDCLRRLEVTDINSNPCPLWSYAGPLFHAEHGCMQKETQDVIFKRNIESIRNCDLLFANIGGRHYKPPDCFGTFVEIGLAHALGKPIYIAFDYELIFRIREFWIAIKCARETNTYKTQDDLVRFS
jgi:hypothetical protein